MKHLQVHNPRFITYSDSLFTADVLGGVDLQQIERMICTPAGYLPELPTPAHHARPVQRPANR